MFAIENLLAFQAGGDSFAHVFFGRTDTSAEDCPSVSLRLEKARNNHEGKAAEAASMRFVVGPGLEPARVGAVPKVILQDLAEGGQGAVRRKLGEGFTG